MSTPKTPQAPKPTQPHPSSTPPSPEPAEPPQPRPTPGETGTEIPGKELPKPV